LIKAILFSIDDTLYESSLQYEMSRMNAVKAMVEAGLPVDVEQAFNVLNNVVNKYGPYYSKHFDRMIEELGLKLDSSIIAAGVVAYRETSLAFIKPYPDTIPTLLKLRDHGYKLGVISNGDPVKQWQKLIKINVSHLFHHVLFAKDQNREKVDTKTINESLDALGINPSEALFVCSKVSDGINEAKSLGIKTIRLRRIPTLETEEITANFEITRLREVHSIIEQLKDT
jgi:putative hydrolase of the HAD superfamily